MNENRTLRGRQMTELSNERLAAMLNAEVPFDMATDTMRSILTELLSLRQSHSTGSVVKGLEWLDNVARTPFGDYWMIVGIDSRVTLGAPGWSSGEWKKYPTIEVSRCAAQADYERRILSALSPEPADGQTVLVTAASLIAIRDALAAENINEAWHQLYSIADPTFCQVEPWRNLEHKAALSPVHKDGEPGDLRNKAIALKRSLEMEGCTNAYLRDDIEAMIAAVLSPIPPSPVLSDSEVVAWQHKLTGVIRTDKLAVGLGLHGDYTPLYTHPKEAEADADLNSKWRDLALQFDAHRIEALSLIRYAVKSIEGYTLEQGILREPLAALKEFLSRPPLSGEAVLAERLQDLASKEAEVTVTEEDVEHHMPEPDFYSDGYQILARPFNHNGFEARSLFSEQTVRAALVAALQVRS